MDSQFQYPCAIRLISLIHLIQRDPKPKWEKCEWKCSWTHALFAHTINEPVTVKVKYWIAWQHMKVFTQNQRRIQDFLEEGRQPSRWGRQPIIWSKISRKLHENPCPSLSVDTFICYNATQYFTLTVTGAVSVHVIKAWTRINPCCVIFGKNFRENELFLLLFFQFLNTCNSE